MTALVPECPKIYHIVHVDRLPSIIKDSGLWCDAVMAGRKNTGTTIGIDNIKQRRRSKALSCHSDLHVGDCVPFYFCPRSVMLYVLHKSSLPELTYHDGQVPIIHLEADLHCVIQWAEKRKRLWAFTTSNAGSNHFEDFSDVTQLEKIDWDAVQSKTWTNTSQFPNRKELKQAELLVQLSFPWTLIKRIGVYSPQIRNRVLSALRLAKISPLVEIKRDWYYS